LPIRTEPVEQVTFKSLAQVHDWIQGTETALRRIPFKGLLEHGARFRDDAYLGDDDVLLHFNQPGLQALCQSVGFRSDQLQRLAAPSLASEVLNDLLSQSQVQAELDALDLVVHEDTGLVIGLVGQSYVTYSNAQFLADAEALLKAAAADEPLEFHEACAINTELTLRVTSTRRHGTIQGTGGEGEDKSTLGLDLKNSMVGTSSVRINYFLHRLACANGLMVPAAESLNRVFHSGQARPSIDALNVSFVR
jgi:hypothetical protein